METTKYSILSKLVLKSLLKSIIRMPPKTFTAIEVYKFQNEFKKLGFI